MKENGYEMKRYGYPVKRYCQTMDLKDDPELIAKYRECHSKEKSWREIREGIRSVGILEMEIYICGNRLFMIVETPIDFDWESAMAKLATLPRQQEWEDFVSVFQQCRKGELAKEKWLSGNFWLVSFKISYLCLPLFHETRTTPSCHPSGCAYRQL